MEIAILQNSQNKLQQFKMPVSSSWLHFCSKSKVTAFKNFCMEKLRCFKVMLGQYKILNSFSFPKFFWIMKKNYIYMICDDIYDICVHIHSMMTFRGWLGKSGHYTGGDNIVVPVWVQPDMIVAVLSAGHSYLPSVCRLDCSQQTINRENHQSSIWSFIVVPWLRKCAWLFDTNSR